MISLGYSDQLSKAIGVSDFRCLSLPFPVFIPRYPNVNTNAEIR